MSNNYQQNQEDFVEAMQDGDMTYIEYVNQHDQSFRAEYKEYCKDNGLDPAEEDSAISFIEYKEEEMDSNMEN